jgi:hypothetical protein
MPRAMDVIGPELRLLAELHVCNFSVLADIQTLFFLLVADAKTEGRLDRNRKTTEIAKV